MMNLPSFNRRSRVVFAAAMLSAATLAFAGCASDSGGSAASTSSASGSLTHIKIVVQAIHFEPAYIAQQEGYFAQNGLDVEIVNGGSPVQNVASAVSGDAQIVMGSWGTAITSIDQGIPVQVISGNGYTSPDFATSGVVVKADSPIKTPADLAGKTVGVAGVNTGSEVPMLIGAAAAGIDPTSITRVETASSGMGTALDSGTIDAALALSPYYGQLLASGDRVIMTPSMTYLPHAPSTVWMATTDWLSSNGDTAKAFNAAMTEADAYYNDPANKDAVYDITAKVSQVDRSKLNGSTLIPMNIQVDTTAAQKLSDGFVTYKIVPTAPTIDQILWSDAPRSTN